MRTAGFICVCFNSVFCVVIFDGRFALSDFPGGSDVKRLSAMRETQVQSLGWEDPLEKQMAAHSKSVLAWRISWTAEPGRLPSMGSQRVGHD